MSPSYLCLWSIRRGCHGEAPRQLFHGVRRHPSHFHLPFKAVDECPERANRLCRQDAFLRKCFLALDKLAGSFCLFPDSREISWSIMISFRGSGLSSEIGIVMFVDMEIRQTAAINEEQNTCLLAGWLYPPSLSLSRLPTKILFSLCQSGSDSCY